MPFAVVPSSSAGSSETGWPSTALYSAIDHLAQSLIGLGPHRLSAERDRKLVENLLSQFIDRLGQALAGSASISAFDGELLSHLGSIAGQDGPSPPWQNDRVRVHVSSCFEN